MPKASETPSKPKAAAYRTPKSNRCTKDQVYIPEVGEQPSRKGKKRPRVEEAEVDEDSPSVPHSHPWKVRLICALGYHDWVKAGSKKSESPFDGWKKDHGVERSLPARWLKKLHETGTVHDSWAGGRPVEFGPETKSLIKEIALNRAKEQKRCSASHMRKEMVKRGVKKLPSESTITKLKKAMRFTVTKVILHPQLNDKMKAIRLPYARK